MSAVTLKSIQMIKDGAWRLSMGSVSRLFSATYRGENRTLPGVAGRVVRPIVLDQLIVDMELHVLGMKDNTGAAHTNVTVGKVENLAYLWTQLGLESAPVTLAVDTGVSQYTAQVQVTNWMVLREGNTNATVTFDLVIPAGKLTKK
jgi:hypothetical protein